MYMNRWLIFGLSLAVTFAFLAEPAAAEINILAAGDACFSNRLEAIGKARGYDYFFNGISFHSKQADISFLNLETCISKRGQPLSKEYTFRSDPEAVKAIKKAGFSVVSVANNHSYDYGKDAFLDTLFYLEEAGVLAAGGGRNETEAFSPVWINIGSKKIAFFAFTDVVPYGFAAVASKPGVASAKNVNRVIEAVSVWSQKADLTIVSLHWGTELSYYPQKRQVELAHRLIDAGADIIFGHHPHVVQPVEVYREKPVFYSLGNFIFSPGNESGRYSMVAIVQVDYLGRPCTLTVFPVIITAGRPEIAGKSWLKQLFGLVNKMDEGFVEKNGYLIREICRPVGKDFRPVILFEKKYFAQET